MKKYIIICLLSLVSLLSFGQRTNQAYWTYIDKYKDWAIEQMHQYGIPASITLAQGLLESNAGRSSLATQANNHFGIKVGGSWTGPYIVKSDDHPNDRFRKYVSASTRVPKTVTLTTRSSSSKGAIKAFTVSARPTTKAGQEA